MTLVKSKLKSPSLRVERDSCDEVIIRVSITKNKFIIFYHHNLHILSHLQIIFTFNFKEFHQYLIPSC